MIYSNRENVLNCSKGYKLINKFRQGKKIKLRERKVE